jgi:hypothetical protein
VQDEKGCTSRNGALEVVRLLLEHGDVEVKGNDGLTAWQLVAKEGHDEIGAPRFGNFATLGIISV